MTKIESGDTQAPDKKAWQSLKIETLSVPSATQSGFNRLDPAETFVFYRTS